MSHKVSLPQRCIRNWLWQQTSRYSKQFASYSWHLLERLVFHPRVTCELVIWSWDAKDTLPIFVFLIWSFKRQKKRGKAEKISLVSFSSFPSNFFTGLSCCTTSLVLQVMGNGSLYLKAIHTLKAETPGEMWAEMQRMTREFGAPAETEPNCLHSPPTSPEGSSGLGALLVQRKEQPA